MALEIVLSPALHDRLVRHLHRSDIEEVAFLAGRHIVGSAAIDAFDILSLEADDFAIQTDYHVRLTDNGRRRVIRWAHEESAVLVEAHAHRSDWPAQFSPSDVPGLREWVPHVRWRLSGRPYAALVFGRDSFDGLVWTNGADGAGPIAGLHVGDQLLEPTGLSHAELMSPRKVWER